MQEFHAVCLIFVSIPDIIDKRIRIGVTIVGGVVFTPLFLPAGSIIRKERVGLVGCIVNLCQTETVGVIQQVVVKAGTSYYIYVLIGLAADDEIIPTRKTFAARQ